MSSKFKDVVNNLIKWGKENDPEFRENDLSDGYHTFDELYEFRMLYNAALFNEWANNYEPWRDRPGDNDYSVHKSKRHHNGELCFGGGWFIVVAVLPSGQISNHYKIEHWDLFDIPETERAAFEFDGHTSSDVVSRLRELLNTHTA